MYEALAEITNHTVLWTGTQPVSYKVFLLGTFTCIGGNAPIRTALAEVLFIEEGEIGKSDVVDGSRMT